LTIYGTIELLMIIMDYSNVLAGVYTTFSYFGRLPNRSVLILFKSGTVLYTHWDREAMLIAYSDHRCLHCPSCANIPLNSAIKPSVKLIDSQCPVFSPFLWKPNLIFIYRVSGYKRRFIGVLSVPRCAEDVSRHVTFVGCVLRVTYTEKERCALICYCS
jgi:hypothetical protein